MKAKIISVLCFISIMALPDIQAQKGVEDGSRYGHGDDSVRCVTNLSLYREYARQKDYKSAVKYWRIVFNECPVSTKNIYIDGVRIFKDFIENEDNDGIRSGYVDTLMMIYDQRIKYYPRDRGDQRGRQGVDLLRYKRLDDIKYVRQAYDYLEESIDLEKNETSEAVVATYFTSAITLFQNGELDESKLIQDYIKSNNILVFQIKKFQNNPTPSEIKTQQDKNMQNLKLSCDLLVEQFSKLFEKDPREISDLQTITSVMNAMACTDQALYYQAAKELYKLKPSAESAANLAMLSFDKTEYDVAVSYFEQAIQLETSAETKALYYLGLAKCLYKQNKKPQARDNALKAIELKDNWGEPYLIIGQMYAESVDDCSDLCLPKSVYWVAVDKFNKAKLVDSSVEDQANKLILTYSSYFPNKENSFFCGINDGDPYTVNCWINETTKARF
jgi:tetratricopeptide (TPR) repeat protein